MMRPKLNPIEAFPAEHDGQELVCLRDPYHISDRVLYVSRETLYIIGMFNGEHTLEDVQNEILKEFGQRIEAADIENLISQLDEYLFLDSDKYHEHKINLERSFIDSEIRPASHAGISYPGDADELRGWIDDFFNKAEGLAPKQPRQENIRGIISPHIDFSRGGKSYALAYRELTEDPEADTYFIFGTSHYAEVENPFILTKKDFETPLGRALNDTDIVDNLQQSCTWDLFEGEISHRTEHSIEFQVAFLQYLLDGKREFKIVPILCNSFYRHVESGESPAQDERVKHFLGHMKRIISDLGQRAFVIAGADMAHVGPKFGDSEAVNDGTLSLIRERDLLSLGRCENLDAEGFYRSVENEKDWRKICGLSPIYSLLSTTPASRGKVLDYDQALEPDTGSVVSFASAAFYS